MDLRKLMQGMSEGMSEAGLSKGVNEFKRSEMISLKSCHGKFLSAHPDGCVNWGKSEAGAEEQFFVCNRGDRLYMLESSSGKYLSAQPDGRVEWNRDKADVWETWTIEWNEGLVSLKSFHEKYLSAMPDGHVEASRKAARQWEMFDAVRY